VLGPGGHTAQTFALLNALQDKVEALKRDVD
jgi:hypothetical protein